MKSPYNHKSALRHHFSELRSSLTPEERTTAEAAIHEALFALPAWKNAAVVCGYVSMRGELDMTPIQERAAAEGKTYALPVTVTNAREGRMIFRALPGGATDRLAPARFGIREPDESCPALEAGDLAGALILVPALAFDRDGYRIGYGGGYYDRFLQALQAAGIPVTTAGLVFSVCHTDTLPREPHDIPVDLILDERRIIVPDGIHEHP